MTKRRILYFVTVVALVLLLGVVFIACADKQEYGRRHEFDQINANSVLHIEKTRLTFTKGMDVDSAQIIAECECEIVDSKTGKHVKILADDLTSGLVSYEKFDLTTAGRDKSIAVSFKNAKNYIFYDVIDFKVNYYEDREMTKLWKSAPASSALSTDGSLSLAVWIDTIQNNYATDETNRTTAPQKAMSFNGWYDYTDSAVTGRYVLSVPATGVERVINLYADFLSEEQMAGLDLRYDNAGRLVFYGYEGNADELRLPEGVTYIDMQSVFEGVTAENPVGFKKLVIPSTAQMDVPFTVGVNSIGLNSVEVDDGNPYMASYKSAVYSKDYTSLYFMPASAPNDGFHEMLTEFASYSCAYWQIQALNLPESVTTLQNFCFAYSAIKSMAGLDRVSLAAGVFAGTDFKSKDDGVALYTILSETGGVTKYGLSMVLDKTITEYTVLEGTVDIAGDAFNGCEKLTKINLGNSVKNIGQSAFAGCKALTEITLPSTLETMGAAVFYNCESLKKVEGLNDVTFVDGSDSYEHTLPSRLFYGCKSLTDVVLPDGVVSIGSSSSSSTFNGCESLTSVSLPNSVENINSAAFASCGLTSIEFPSGLKTLGSQAFMNCVNLTQTNLDKCAALTALPRYCFYGAGLKNVVLPSQITTIPPYCFYNMPNLLSIDITNIKTLDTYAVAQNSKLTTIVFGDKLETIGTRAFSSDKALTSVVIPDSVKTIGGYAFASCSKLAEITIGSGVESIGVYQLENDGVTFGDGAKTSPVFYLCTGLKQINVAAGNTEFTSIDGVLYGKSVGGKDFGEAGVLYAVPSNYQQTSLTLPDSVRVILPYAVHSQQKLTAIELNNGLQNIGKGAFYNSKKLTSLTLPSSVTNIGASILLSCTGIENFEIAEGNQRYSSDGNIVYDGNKVVMYLGLNAAVVIRNGITEIETGVFMNNAVIKSVVIPDSVTTVGDKAFSGCTKLEAITIGAGLKNISADAFASLSALQTITVSANNQNYKAVNNVLYTKDGKKVLLAAAKNGMTGLDGLESGVEEIGEYAFAYHATLSAVKLPATVKKINAYAFYECRAVEYFYASEMLESIGERAFSFATSINKDDSKETRYCDTLKNVVLYGNLQVIEENAFYGQYGIVHVFFRMTYSQVNTLLSNSGKNYGYLTKGCPEGDTGSRYNQVTCCLYSATEPTIDYNGYSWFFFEDGEPHIYQSGNGR